MTKEKDIVLINVENKAVSFARIEEIIPDSKLGWFKTKLMLLQIPIAIVTWILRENYINGDKFKMEGQTMQLEKITCPNEISEVKHKRKKNDNIIPLFKT